MIFHRVTHSFLSIQLVVKPNDKRSGKPLHDAIQEATAFVSDQQLRGEFDQEVGAAGRAMTLVFIRHDVREIQQADEAVRSLGRWR